MVSLIDKCLTGQDKFQNFLDVVKECNIQTGDDFVHFMAVIKEHCLDKGITDYKEIIKVWNEHKQSLKDIVKNINDYTNSLNKENR